MNVAIRTPADAQAYMEAFGYQSLVQFQRTYQLLPSGTLDEATLAAMNAPRCGLPDGAIALRSRNRLAKWNKNRLLIAIEDYLPAEYISREGYEEAVLAAGRGWTNVANIGFDLTRGRTADIVLQCKLIDGKGQTLAYAYFPNGSTLPLVMDRGEAWDKPYGPEIVPVVGHELGHNLGIDHDPNSGGLMAAFYSAKRKKPMAGYDTEQAQLRYGKPMQPAPGPTPGEPEEYTIHVAGGRVSIDGYDLVPRRS